MMVWKMSFLFGEGNITKNAEGCCEHLVFAYILRRFCLVCFTFFNRLFASCALSEASTNRVRNEISGLEGVPSLELNSLCLTMETSFLLGMALFSGGTVSFWEGTSCPVGVFFDPTFLTKNQ